MISSISGLLSLNNLDMTSCANDVIVVRHPTGHLFSTPFNVRFGKVKVLRPSEKVVQVEVNGVSTSAVMKMGSDGEAFWLKPTQPSECDGGRPESPVMCASCQNNNNGGSDSNDNDDDATSLVHSLVNGCDISLPPLQQSSELTSSPLKATKRDEKVAEPLIEEDGEGHLKVNAGARRSVKDVAEVHLAEKTVVAAEQAMREIARLRIEGDEYLRQMAMREKEEGVLSPPLLASEHSADAYPGLCDNIHLLSDVVSSPSLSGVYLASVCSPRISTTAVCFESVAPEDDGDGEDPVPLPPAAEQVGAEGNDGEMLAAAVMAVPEEDENIHAREEESPVNDAPSLVPSDEVFDSSGDDYLLEDLHELHECDVDPGTMAAVGVTSSNVSSAQGTSIGAAGNAPTLSCPHDQQAQDNTTSCDDANGMVYFARTLIPTEADLHKLNLIEGHNRIRYITRSALRGEVAVEANVYLWDSNDRLVVSDVDGTITKSDVWGHLMPLIGRDWTHPGICSLYSKIHQNGYKFVYLTARSVSQVGMTRSFLWNIRQDGFSLPKGPVLTAPQRFFTALSQEVSKRSHVFKIACLKSVMDTFPKNKKPFYAGFGNRFNDMLSYTATQIPQHKIFIIDPNSVLHVYNVKQTYKNLAHLVDMTFPPVVKRHQTNMFGIMAEPQNLGNTFADSDVTSNGSFTLVGGLRTSTSQGATSLEENGKNLRGSVEGERSRLSSLNALDATGVVCAGNCFRGHNATLGASQGTHCDLSVDREFDSFLYWRVQPASLLCEAKKKSKEEEEGGKKKGAAVTDDVNNKEPNQQQQQKEPSEQTRRRRVTTYLSFSLGSYTSHNDGASPKSGATRGTPEDTKTCEQTSPQWAATSPSVSAPSPAREL